MKYTTLMDKGGTLRIHPSIHFYHSIPTQSHGGTGAYPILHLAKAGYTLYKLAVHQRADTVKIFLKLFKKCI